MAIITGRETVKQGSTEAFTLQVLRNGLPFNLTGCAAALKRRNLKSTAEDEFTTAGPAPLLTIENASAGRLRFSPDAAVWPSAGVKYRAFIRVTTGGGAVLDFPGVGAYEFTVVAHY